MFHHYLGELHHDFPKRFFRSEKKDLHSATPGACGGEQGEMGWLSVVLVNDSDPMDDIYIYVYI